MVKPLLCVLEIVRARMSVSQVHFFNEISGGDFLSYGVCVLSSAVGRELAAVERD